MGVAQYSLHLKMITLYVKIYQDYILTLPPASLSHSIVVCEMDIIMIIITLVVTIK